MRQQIPKVGVASCARPVPTGPRIESAVDQFCFFSYNVCRMLRQLIIFTHVIGFFVRREMLRVFLQRSGPKVSNIGLLKVNPRHAIMPSQPRGRIQLHFASYLHA